MDIQRAKELLKMLADGVNPLTGEVLDYNDSCNQGEIVRALNTAVTELEKLIAKKNQTSARQCWQTLDKRRGRSAC